MNSLTCQFGFNLLSESHYLVALTGAGISTASGIPAFRGSDGLWSRFDPGIYGSIQGFNTDPKTSWEFFLHLYETLSEAKPNAAHYALARLEHAKILRYTITQNIDGLHHDAGQENVIEIHGSLRTLVCTSCQRCISTKGLILDTQEIPPLCSCGGILKPDAVLFGEPIPSDRYFSALEQIRRADVVLLAGTSGLVHPVSEFPEIALSHGARLVEINVTPTILTKRFDTVLIEGCAEDVLPVLAENLVRQRKYI